LFSSGVDKIGKKKNKIKIKIKIEIKNLTLGASVTPITDKAIDFY
jgi:hypothetical protein